jgi:hypothetical protein
VRGDDHSDTLTVASNMALTLFNKGEVTEVGLAEYI